jgi:hypothetical protein
MQCLLYLHYVGSCLIAQLQIGQLKAHLPKKLRFGALTLGGMDSLVWIYSRFGDFSRKSAPVCTQLRVIYCFNYLSHIPLLRFLNEDIVKS